MEYTLTLTGVARLQIMGILNEKAIGKGGDREYGIAADLYDKIYISDEEQEQLSTKQRDGSRILMPDLIRAMPDLEVKLNFLEMSTLEKVLKEFILRPMDRKLWWARVMMQLEEAKKPELEDESTRSKRLAARNAHSIDNRGGLQKQ